MPPPSAAKRKKSLVSHPMISQRGIRVVAVYAECDPRCVVKYLRDMPTTDSTRARVERALHRAGFSHLVRERPNGAPIVDVDHTPASSSANGVGATRPKS